jgi:hypothetical protein
MPSPKPIPYGVGLETTELVTTLWNYSDYLSIMNKKLATGLMMNKLLVTTS